MEAHNDMNHHSHHRTLRRALAGALVLATTAGLAACLNTSAEKAEDAPPPPGGVWDAHLDNPRAISELLGQSAADADEKSRGCLVCHEGIEKPHASQTVQLGCVDCHGGDPTADAMEDAHVLSGDPARDAESTTPPSEAAQWLHLSWDYVRFVNPGDLRVAESTCGPCHPNETYNTKKSMMAHSGFLYGAAL